MQRQIITFAKGETVQGYYLLKSMTLKTSNNNNRYYDLIISDQTGEINGKIWDPDMVEGTEITEGIVVKIRGLVNEWQGQLQLKVERIRKTNAGDNINVEDFIQSAPYTAMQMMDEIRNYLIRIENEDIRQITRVMLNENAEKLMYYPAAMKNHHSIRGGLLYHLTTMLKMAERVLEVYTHLNGDLLYAGVILHDLAKIKEMDANELGIVSSYSPEGMLLGHLIQGIKDIERIGSENNADREIIVLLEHMLLSHHYEPEYGSPKRPMIPEAEILHYLDMIDARMFDMQKALETVSPGEFSDKIWLLNNRQLYRPFLND
ncbi:MAG: HD domain-containing protein [Clostridiales bacterium]|nr:HD domain-containing protein [Clostridiales bacterium]